jgi:ketosteroid isomerase-like protein
MTARDPAIQELLDKQAIREVIMRYCRGVDRSDAPLINSAYHPDAVGDYGTRQFAGETAGEAISAWVRSATHLMHHVTNQVIHVEGDRAGCESYYAVWRIEQLDDGERVLQALGRYVDRFERRDGEWRISHRVVINEVVRYLPPESYPVDAHTDLGRSDRSDPSYAVLENG